MGGLSLSWPPYSNIHWWQWITNPKRRKNVLPPSTTFPMWLHKRSQKIDHTVTLFFPGWSRRYSAHDSSVFNFSREKHWGLRRGSLGYSDLEHVCRLKIKDFARYASNSYEKQKIAQEELEKEVGTVFVPSENDGKNWYERLSFNTFIFSQMIYMYDTFLWSDVFSPYVCFPRQLVGEANTCDWSLPTHGDWNTGRLWIWERTHSGEFHQIWEMIHQIWGTITHVYWLYVFYSPRRLINTWGISPPRPDDDLSTSGRRYALTMWCDVVWTNWHEHVWLIPNKLCRKDGRVN